jgi:hypothetical protein
VIWQQAPCSFICRKFTQGLERQAVLATQTDSLRTKPNRQRCDRTLATAGTLLTRRQLAVQLLGAPGCPAAMDNFDDAASRRRCVICWCRNSDRKRHSATARKALNDWLTARASAWARSTGVSSKLQRGGNVAVEEALEAASDYRRIGRDLSLAQQLGAPPSTTSFRAAVTPVCTGADAAGDADRGDDLRAMLQHAVPAAIVRLRPRSSGSPCCCSGWPPSAGSRHAQPGARRARGLESNDRRGRERASVDGRSAEPGAACRPVRTDLHEQHPRPISACCIGALYGLGTFYMIGINGFMLGAAFAFHPVKHGLDGRLFEFVVGHGIVRAVGHRDRGRGRSLARRGIDPARAADTPCGSKAPFVRPPR